MKKMLFAAVAILTAMSGCAPKGAGPEAMKSENDSANYYVGYSIGMQIKAIGMEEADFSCIEEGIQAALNGVEVDPYELNNFMNNYVQKMREIAGMKAFEAEKKHFAELAERNDVQELSDGIYYRVITEGTGVKPAAEDVVKVNYEGRLLDGKVFDSSYQRNQPAEFPLNRVIRGWTIALQQMPVGSKWEIHIPSALAYGAYGSGEIGPNATLIFEVELLDVTPAENNAE